MRHVQNLNKSKIVNDYTVNYFSVNLATVSEYLCTQISLPENLVALLIELQLYKDLTTEKWPWLKVCTSIYLGNCYVTFIF